MDGSNSSHSNRWYFLSSAPALPGDKVSCQPVICITFIICRYLSSPPPPSHHPRSRSEGEIFIFKQFPGAAGRAGRPRSLLWWCSMWEVRYGGDIVSMSVWCHRNVLSAHPTSTTSNHGGLQGLSSPSSWASSWQQSAAMSSSITAIITFKVYIVLWTFEWKIFRNEDVNCLNLRLNLEIAQCEIHSHTPFYTTLDNHLKTNLVIMGIFLESPQKKMAEKP